MSRLRRALAAVLAPRGTRRVAAVPARPPGPPVPPGSSVGYQPQVDGLPDPGEVVWAWVPFEEDATRGKDRPVLLLGRRDERWLALMLTSQDHDLDAADEARWGRYWMDVGTGDWDRERRPSEVRLDRLLELDAAGIRREGAALDPSTFASVLAEARRFHALG